ncbi:hypothetical protein AM593_01258, partial [Mytilus galloprovincialis]
MGRRVKNSQNQKDTTAHQFYLLIESCLPVVVGTTLNLLEMKGYFRENGGRKGFAHLYLQVDAIDYYKYEEDVLIAESESQKVTAYRDPAGIAFVTFEIDYMAEKVLTDFKAACKGTHNPLQSKLSVEDWRVKYAPSPENIYWENLSKSTIVWWIQAITINMFLIILLFFFTTPLIVINNLNEININVSAATEKISPFVEQFVPTILLWTFAALLPNIVYWSDQLVGHWTRLYHVTFFSHNDNNNCRTSQYNGKVLCLPVTDGAHSSITWFDKCKSLIPVVCDGFTEKFQME